MGRLPFVPVPKPRPDIDEKVRKLEQEDLDRARYQAIYKAVAGRHVPERYAKANLDAIAGIPLDSADGYVQTTETIKNLLTEPSIMALIGEPGTGKTWMACGLINLFCKQARSGRYIKAADYIADIRSTWGKSDARTPSKAEQEYINPALLVVDEWQVRGGTDSENVHLFRLIDKRYDAQKSTLIISNHVTTDEFYGSIDLRIASRMQDNGGGVLICDWPSLRGRVK